LAAVNGAPACRDQKRCECRQVTQPPDGSSDIEKLHGVLSGRNQIVLARSAGIATERAVPAATHPDLPPLPVRRGFMSEPDFRGPLGPRGEPTAMAPHAPHSTEAGSSRRLSIPCAALPPPSFRGGAWPTELPAMEVACIRRYGKGTGVRSKPVAAGETDRPRCPVPAVSTYGPKGTFTLVSWA